MLRTHACFVCFWWTGARNGGLMERMGFQNAICWLPVCGSGINPSSIALLLTSSSIVGMQEGKDTHAFSFLMDAACTLKARTNPRMPSTRHPFVLVHGSSSSSPPSQPLVHAS